jgi:hypothetical protein
MRRKRYGASSLLTVGQAAGAGTTAAEMRAGFYAMPKGTTLGGLSSPLTFKKGATFNNACYFLMGNKNQKFVSLNGSKDFCVKL